MLCRQIYLLLAALSSQLCFSQTNTAYIPGDIPDGTPPVPEPAKPGFVVPARDVLSSVARVQPDGSKMTIQQIKPQPLPKQPVIKAPSLADSTVFREELDASGASQSKAELLSIGATIYRSKNAEPRTLVRISAMNSDSGEKGETSFWSSADFAYLSGFASFVGSDGISRSLTMGWGKSRHRRHHRAINKTGQGIYGAKSP
jgi:hypothetical protein